MHQTNKMKVITYSPRESSYKLIANIGTTILIFGIIFSIIGFIVGFISFEDGSGVSIIGYSLVTFFSSLFCYAVCKGISELVFRSYLSFKRQVNELLEQETIFEKKRN